jgi:hypothetical protein
MPTWIDETPARQHDRDRHPGSPPAAEARNSDAASQPIETPQHRPHAGYDAELNPIDDEEINTHGSER